MSWNKNTSNFSEIDSNIEVLDNLSIPYSLSVLGNVCARGINDLVDYYPMRRLEFKGQVVLEKMCRNCDCDCDDSIYSEKFKLEDEPKNWSFEEECSCGECS